LFITGGTQVPEIPSKELGGSWGMASPKQKGPIGLKVGSITIFWFVEDLRGLLISLKSWNA